MQRVWGVGSSSSSFQRITRGVRGFHSHLIWRLVWLDSCGVEVEYLPMGGALTAYHLDWQ